MEIQIHEKFISCFFIFIAYENYERLLVYCVIHISENCLNFFGPPCMFKCTRASTLGISSH